ncbi:MAG: NAD-dependent epimerase/dehydratase family protein [Pseudomonadota bacterium]
MRTIAILGASGHIAKGLVGEFRDQARLSLFARNPRSIEAYLDANLADRRGIEVGPYAAFAGAECEVVINAAGPGDPRAIDRAGAELLGWTAKVDDLVLDYVARRPATIYVFLSTGAIYSLAEGEAAGPDSEARLPVNRLGPRHVYALAKLVAEARHRALSQFRIADIRVFGYFSRQIDLDGGFFLAELANCLVNGQRFLTSAHNFVRDFVGADDLAHLIRLLVAAGAPNNAYDICSAAPVTKVEVIEVLAQRYGLEFRIEGAADFADRDLVKPATISRHDAAAKIGYAPRKGSMELIVREIGAMVGR